MFRMLSVALFLSGCAASQAFAQQLALDGTPTQAVYEYQLNYQLPWQRWYGGPGLSLGGTMPTQRVFGYSSLNGIPFPAPLGAGVYVNSPAPHGVGMPVPSPFGPGPMGPMGPMMPGIASPNLAMMNNLQMMGATGPSAMPPQAMQNPAGAPAPQRRRQVPASTPGAKRMSVEQQNLGDTKLREQQWTQAYVNYRNATDLAPDRPEAHFRLGLAFTAMKQYSSAIREFKRSLELDPTLPQSGDKLATIFGADSKLAQTTILPPVADWTREDLADTDRLFLLGLLLHYDDDPRGSEILEAAQRAAGPKDYIQAFLNPAEVPNEPARRPARRGAAMPRTDDGIGPNTGEDFLPPSPGLSVPPSGDPYPEPPPT